MFSIKIKICIIFKCSFSKHNKVKNLTILLTLAAVYFNNWLERIFQKINLRTINNFIMVRTKNVSYIITNYVTFWINTYYKKKSCSDTDGGNWSFDPQIVYYYYFKFPERKDKILHSTDDSDILSDVRYNII